MSTRSVDASDINNSFDAFLLAYSDKYEHKLGFLRPVIPKVVNKFLGLQPAA